MPLARAVNDRLRAAADAEQLLARPHYPAYLLARLRATSLWLLWQRLLTLSRRWRLLTLTLRIAARVITWLETGTFFLLYLLLVLVALPLLLLGSLLLLVIGLLQHRRCTAQLADVLEEDPRGNIYVCFAQRPALHPDSYFGGMVRELAQTQGNTVLIVSPYFRRADGVAPSRPYLAMRREAPHLYLIRRHLYFHLRRRLLLPRRAHLTLLY